MALSYYLSLGGYHHACMCHMPVTRSQLINPASRSFRSRPENEKKPAWRGLNWNHERTAAHPRQRFSLANPRISACSSEGPKLVAWEG